MDETLLYKTAELLRGKLKSSDYADYILAIVCYQSLCMLDDLHKDTPDKMFFNIPIILNIRSILDALKKDPSYDTIDALQKAFAFIQDKLKQYDDDYSSIFDSCNLDSSSLGQTRMQRNSTINPILIHLDSAVHSQPMANLGDIYEFFINHFAQSNRFFGEFYTPKEIAELQVELLLDEDVHSVYDPTCGSGGLLLQAIKKNPQLKVYGQELNKATHHLCIMNLLMHGIHPSQMQIRHGDVLDNPKHVGTSFDLIVANPPFSVSWNADNHKNESRFPILAPKGKADLAFVQHISWYLNDYGKASIILPHGVLFRGGSEAKIRQWFVDNNLIDSIISLPPNAFYSTSIPTMMMILRRNREKDAPILFIEAKSEYVKDKKFNRIIKDRILDVYTTKKEIPQFSKLVKKSEIVQNEYNLNMSRYICTIEEEEQIDLEKVILEHNELSKDIKHLTCKMNDHLKAMGIKTLLEI